MCINIYLLNLDLVINELIVGGLPAHGIWKPMIVSHDIISDESYLKT
jgi:hypothetical protein